MESAWERGDIGCIIGGKIENWGSCMRLCMYKQYLPYRDLPGVMLRSK